MVAELSFWNTLRYSECREKILSKDTVLCSVPKLRSGADKIARPCYFLPSLFP